MDFRIKNEGEKKKEWHADFWFRKNGFQLRRKEKQEKTWGRYRKPVWEYAKHQESGYTDVVLEERPMIDESIGIIDMPLEAPGMGEASQEEYEVRRAAVKDSALSRVKHRERKGFLKRHLRKSISDRASGKEGDDWGESDVMEAK